MLGLFLSFRLWPNTLSGSFPPLSPSQWLNIRRVCPVTQVTLKRHRLTPNLSLRTLIEAWIEEKDKEREATLESQAKDKAEHASDSETSQEGDDSECPTPSERDLN